MPHSLCYSLTGSAWFLVAVRHIVRLPVDLASEDLAKEVAEYRAVGWRVAWSVSIAAWGLSR